MKLTYKQTIALDLLEDHSENAKTEILYGGSAGGGKSFLGCYWLIKNCLRYPGTRWLMGRAKLKTLKETTFNSFMDVCKLQGLENGIHWKINNQSNVITFVNGSEILLKDLFFYPSDPNFDELGSLEITGAFCDEVNQLVEKAWNIVTSRIRYKLDEYGLKPKAFGTLNPAKQWCYFEYYRPFIKGTLKSYRAFIPALVSDNVFISQHYVDNLKKLPEIDKQRLYYGNWDYEYNPTCIFTMESIANMFTNVIPPEGSKRYISCDVAGTGVDRAVVIYWVGSVIREIWISERCEQKEIKAVINALKARHNVGNSNIVIDADGIGIGLAEEFTGCKKFNNASAPVINSEKGDRKHQADKDFNYTFGNLKAQCYYKFAELAKTTKVAISLDNINYFGHNDNMLDKGDLRDIIAAELDYARRKDPDKDGKIYMYPKDKIKEELGRSPDFADALMMRFYFELNDRKSLFDVLKNRRRNGKA